MYRLMKKQENLTRGNGTCTYAGLDRSAGASQADFAILGIPFDIRTTYRSGARFGPDAIRRAFCKDSWHEATGIDTAAYLKGTDCGNLDMRDMEASYPDGIAAAVGGILETGACPVVLGGDHSITFPELLAYREVYGPVALIHFDSHTDTWGSDADRTHHDHSTPFRRAIEYGCIDPSVSIQMGMRGDLYDESDFDFADRHGLLHVSAVALHRMGMKRAGEMIRRRVGGRKVFVSFDIDFADPAFAPGTGTPVPGGFTSRQILTLLRYGLIGLDIVGFDLVEVAPAYDAGGVTALLASRIVHEFLTCLACKKAGITEYAGAGGNAHV